MGRISGSRQAVAHVLSRDASGEEACNGMVDWIPNAKSILRALRDEYLAAAVSPRSHLLQKNR